MSLINDLLCELHERKAAPPPRMSIHDLQPVRRAPRRHVWLLPLAGVLVASSAWAVFHSDVLPSARDRGSASLASTVTSAVAPSVRVPAAVPLSTAEPAVQLAAQPEMQPDVRQPPEKIQAPVLMPPPVKLASTQREDDAPVVSQQITAAPIHSVDVDETIVSHAVAEEKVTPVLPQPLAKVRAADPTAEGLNLLATARYTEAETVFRGVTRNDPASASGWLHYARAIDAQGRTSEAQAALTQALGRVTEPAPIARALARQMLSRGNVHESLSLLIAYRPAHQLEVDHDAFIAALQQRLGQHDLAAERYRSILSVRPEFAAWWVGLAISEEARGRGEAAIDAYRHANNLGNLDPRLADYVAVRLAAMHGKDAS